MSRSLTAGAFLACALFLASAVPAQRDAARPIPTDIEFQPGRVPKVHYIPTNLPAGKYPFWVDASMFFKRDGQLDTALLTPEGQHVLQVVQTRPIEQGCVQAGANGEDLIDVPDRSSVEEATRTARLVILGKVTDKSYGLSIDVFGQMLRVEPQETLKGEPRHVPAYFVFVPVGNVQVGAVTVCKTDIRYPPAPDIGEQVLLFAPNDADSQENQNEPYLEILDDGGLVTLHSDLSVSQPRRFQPSEPQAIPPTREDLLARIRRVAKWSARPALLRRSARLTTECSVSGSPIASAPTVRLPALI
jgi:hypothetical protein